MHVIFFDSGSPFYVAPIHVVDIMRAYCSFIRLASSHGSPGCLHIIAASVPVTQIQTNDTLLYKENPKTHIAMDSILPASDRLVDLFGWTKRATMSSKLSFFPQRVYMEFFLNKLLLFIACGRMLASYNSIQLFIRTILCNCIACM